ncbi:MAG TPA: hypothetical protein VFS21_21090 [Roseiflexaceae bacterium]|nr:hypothetical protein [Roseiflexaceae bacterium]
MLSTASRDDTLLATVVRVTELRYSEGADELLDRPAHVRAGSSLARLGGLVAVLQDDASFVALIEPEGDLVRAVPLPAGEGGLRLFDDLRGNKHGKLDLEACVALPGGGGDTLLALGSGSSPLREQVAVIEGCAGPAPLVRLYPAPAWYAALRDAEAFAGSELNIEGVVALGETLRLFNRGNGAPLNGREPVDATCDVDLGALLAHLADPQAPAPPPQRIRQYNLGQLDGLRLTFTDAALAPTGLVFSAAAEDSPDATRDGAVAGSALGVLDERGGARWTLLRDSAGARFDGKVEGVLLDAADPARALVVVDVDNPAVPSLLCEVALAGPWF